ncbi:MAG: hypothetical protein V4736_12790, partial [Bdellovibrionota bacterium]
SMEVFRGIKNLATNFVLSCALLVTIGCSGERPYQTASGHVAVKIPVVKKGVFTLDIVDLFGITNLYEFEGDFARFFFSPRVENGQLAGTKAKARFLEVRGTFIPADQSSAEMASIYYHLQNLAKLDEAVGAGNVNTWPRSVAIQALVEDAGGKLRENNAMYDGITDSMAFVPYKSNDIPLSVNPGVIAHEHFHSLFYKLVTVPLIAEGVIPGQSDISLHAIESNKFANSGKSAEQKIIRPSGDYQTDLREIYNWFVLKSLNEGLADVWGWSYTAQPDFIAYSIPSQKPIRSLKASDIPDFTPTIQTAEAVKLFQVEQNLSTSNGRINMKKSRENLVNCCAYELGSSYARFFKAYADLKLNPESEDEFSAQAVNSRQEILKIIVRLLPLIKNEMLNNGKEKDLNTLSILELVSKA